MVIISTASCGQGNTRCSHPQGRRAAFHTEKWGDTPVGTLRGRRLRNHHAAARAGSRKTLQKAIPGQQLLRVVCDGWQDTALLRCPGNPHALPVKFSQ